jgi:hypothetical protein
VKRGDIVTVVNPEDMLSGKQGEVVSISPGGKVLVRFPENCQYLLDQWDQKNMSCSFKKQALRKDADWTMENKADKLFGNHYHSLYTRKDKLDRRKLCEHDQCLRYAHSPALLNIWGSVIVAHTCKRHHEEYHGKCLEAFPWKERATQVAS